ncbi:MAG: hypothetical protein FWC91_05380 [Defluviitaleaceae bacterium]|nr:hypothetical protein [Defluviitaleaceae bacterium]
MSEYFEYMYLATDNFYTYVCQDQYPYNQAAGRCFYDYQLILREEQNAKSLAIYSAILVNLAKCYDNLAEFKDKYNMPLELCSNVSIDTLLTENERDYFNDDMDYIKYKFNAILKA